MSSPGSYATLTTTSHKALESAANISGYELSQHATNLSAYELSQLQEGLCEKIVSRVLKEIEKRRPLHVAKYPVGLATKVQNFESFCSETEGTVGIFGLGGIGKTTLARELFNSKRLRYSASCFLSDVREAHARGSGSLAIITTRDQSVLRGVDSHYKTKGMVWDHAKELFCRHAFRGSDPPTAFEKLIGSFMGFCGGLTLSLKVLGAHVYSQDVHY
ncbi:hypothetical protein SUGI_0667530 [Cryptomeria japonica]|nr:hypothetical protein SUGI_0667530 [Cryptomeria japonica]